MTKSVDIDVIICEANADSAAIFLRSLRLKGGTIWMIKQHKNKF